MKTKYTEKILFYLEGDAPDVEMMEWVEQQPLIDQPDILREFKKIVEEKLGEKGISDINFEDIDEQIAVYEDKILDEKLAEANLVMALQKQDKTMEDLVEAVSSVRKYIISCIINNDENAETMKELAKKVIASEKETGVFDENNWKDIL